MFEQTPQKSLSVGMILLWVWVAFTSLYLFLTVAYPYINKSTVESTAVTAYQNGYNAAVSDALRSFSGNAYQNGKNEGYLTAFINLGQALNAQVSDGCKQVIPIQLGTGVTMGVVNVACLQQPASGAQQPAPQAPAPEAQKK